MLLVPTHDPAVHVHVSEEHLANDLAILREIWCEDVYRARRRLAEARTVIDLGAAFGAFTVLALRTMPFTSRVIAVEPQPANLALLRANLIRHDTLGRRVSVHDVAVSDQRGHTRITDAGGQSRLDEDGQDHVDVVTLVDLIEVNGLQQVDVLKVDIEGYETRALDAVPRDVMKRLRYIAIEYDETSRNLGDLVAKLSETHSVSTLGAWNRGGYVWAEAY